MDVLISSLVGGVIGLIIAVIFEDPLNSAKRRLVKLARSAFHRPRSIDPINQTFSLGKRNSSWLVIDGNGEMTYTPEAIRCLVDSTPVLLPPEIQQLRDNIEKRELSNKDKGLSYQWPGPLYALERYAIGRTNPEENLEVAFTFRPTDYYTFQATVMSLDYNIMQPPAIMTIRQKYLQGCDLVQPVPFLSNGFGISLAIITKDRKLILSWRSDHAGARPGELDVSVVEAVHPLNDRSTTSLNPDLYRTAIRGIQEEIGIDALQENITFLGFGVDIEYYQWNIVGIVRISDTAQKALENRRSGLSGKWEAKNLEVIEAEPRNVFSYIKDKKIWSTGLLTIYWALVYEYGRKRVDMAAKAVFDA